MQARFALQAPDRITVTATFDGKQYRVGRDGQQAWMGSRGDGEGNTGFVALGKAGVPRFKAFPNEIDHTVLGPLSLPVSREQLAVLMLALQAKSLPAETIANDRCQVIAVSIAPAATLLLGSGAADGKAGTRRSGSARRI